MSQSLSDQPSIMTQTGTKDFMPPEMFGHNAINTKVDEWGAGCILCFLLTGLVPANEGQQSGLGSRYEFKAASEILEGKTGPQFELLRGLLSESPADRLSVEDALGHSWFNK